MKPKHTCDTEGCDTVAFVSHSGEYQDKSFCRAHFLADVKKTERILSRERVKPVPIYTEKDV